MPGAEFRIPREADILDALSSLDCKIFVLEDVPSFLLLQAVEKPISDRFISWCIQLGLIPYQRSKWTSNLFSMASNYFEILTRSLPEGANFIPRDTAEICATTLNGLPQTDIPLDGLSDRLQHIFGMILREDRNFRCSPTFVKVSCVCFSMTAAFSIAGGLTLDFAEAIAFYLAKEILKYLSQRSVLTDDQKKSAYIRNLDEVTYSVAGRVYGTLQTRSIDFDAYGLEYESGLYAGHHPYGDMWRIWDQILGRIGQLNAVILSLTAAHVVQFAIVKSKDAKAAILSQQQWDVQKLLADAVSILNRKRNWSQRLCLKCCPSMRLFHGCELAHSDFQ
jgi:hypothetical protein